MALFPGLPHFDLPFAFTITHRSRRAAKKEGLVSFTMWMVLGGCKMVGCRGERYVRTKLESEFLTVKMSHFDPQTQTQTDAWSPYISGLYHSSCWLYYQCQCIGSTEMPRVKLLWSVSGTQISNILDRPNFIGHFRKTIMKILTCLNPWIMQIANSQDAQQWTAVVPALVN